MSLSYAGAYCGAHRDTWTQGSDDNLSGAERHTR